MPAPKATTVPRAFEADERQREAIEHVAGPLLVVAGAGTGKTTVLTKRIASLIREGHAHPEEILAVTYTDNAAEEMRERVQAEVGRNISGIQVATFHAYCHNLLMRSNKQFGVLDDNDLWIYLRKRIHHLHLNHFVRAANVSKFLADLLDFMRRCHDELVGPERYADYVKQLQLGELPIPRVCKSKDVASLTDQEVLGRCQEIAQVFATVEHMLRADNLGTFSHMITGAYQLLREDAELLARERHHARFILVDEFQDANFAQVKILQHLSGDGRNVFAVGDPDQAIYRFRGASSAAFALFQHNFPGAKLVVLEKNRRSITPILQCAFALISKNPDVFSGNKKSAFPYRRSPLVSARDEVTVQQGSQPPNLPVETVILNAREAEGFDLVATIRRRQRETRCKWRDFAVLYRQHQHRNELASELAEQGIPFSIENMDVLDTPQARDIMACLRSVVSSSDSASLLRVAAFSQFTIDPNELRSGMKALPRDERTAGVATVLAKIQGGQAVLSVLQQTRDEIAQTSAKSHAALDIIIRRFAIDSSSPPATAILEFVSSWEKKPKPITATGELGELVEYLDYFRDAGGTICIPSRHDDAVRLMTPHVAKGLEFNQVFIIRAVSPSFPAAFKESLVEFPRELRDPDSVSQWDDKTLHEEEERRLFYVAMTRARDTLTIYAKKGTGKKDPTPPGYLRELLGDASLRRWLRQRPAIPFQTDLFGQARAAVVPSRTTEWLEIPPTSGLGFRLSASAVQSYETCPLQFKLEREWRIPGEVGAAMQYGASMHRVLRSYYDSVRYARPLTQDALISLFRDDLAQAEIEDRYQHDLYEKQGVEQLTEFLASRTRSAAPEVLHTEEPFEMQIGGTTVLGRIDRIDKLPDGRVVITDYKTGKAQSQEDADKSLQLSIYALAAREKWGYQADHLLFYNLGDNGPVVTHRSEAQLEGARHKVQEVADEISAGHFDAKPGFHCSFCAYRNLCPATEKRLFAVSAPKKSNGRN